MFSTHRASTSSESSVAADELPFVHPQQAELLALIGHEASLSRRKVDKAVNAVLLRDDFDWEHVYAIETEAGHGLIHLVAQHNLYRTLETLLNHGVNPNHSDSDHRTALHHGVIHHHANIVVLLLSQPELNAAATDSLGRTALHEAVIHYAAKKPDASILQLLLNPFAATERLVKVTQASQSIEASLNRAAILTRLDNAGFAAVHYAMLLPNHPLTEPQHKRLFNRLLPNTLDARGVGSLDMLMQTQTRQARLVRPMDDSATTRATLWRAFFDARNTESVDTFEAACALVDYLQASPLASQSVGVFAYLANQAPALLERYPELAKAVEAIKSSVSLKGHGGLRPPRALQSPSIVSKQLLTTYNSLNKLAALNAAQCYRYAEVCYSLGYLDAAKSAYLTYLAQSDAVPLDATTVARIQTHLAHIALIQGDYEQAQSYSEQALQQTEGDAALSLRGEALLNNATLYQTTVTHSKQEELFISDEAARFILKLQDAFLIQYHKFRAGKKVKRADLGITSIEAIGTIGYLLPSSIELGAQESAVKYSHDPGMLLEKFSSIMAQYCRDKKLDRAEAVNEKAKQAMELMGLTTLTKQCLDANVGLAVLRFYQLFHLALEQKKYLNNSRFINGVAKRLVDYIYTQHDYHAGQALFMRGLFHGARVKAKSDKYALVADFFQALQIELADSGVGLRLRSGKQIPATTIHLTLQECRDYDLLNYYRQVQGLQQAALPDYQVVSEALVTQLKTTLYTNLSSLTLPWLSPEGQHKRIYATNAGSHPAADATPAVADAAPATEERAMPKEPPTSEAVAGAAPDSQAKAPKSKGKKKKEKRSKTNRTAKGKKKAKKKQTAKSKAEREHEFTMKKLDLEHKEKMAKIERDGAILSLREGGVAALDGGEATAAPDIEEEAFEGTFEEIQQWKREAKAEREAKQGTKTKPSETSSTVQEALKHGVFASGKGSKATVAERLSKKSFKSTGKGNHEGDKRAKKPSERVKEEEVAANKTLGL